MIKRRAQRRVGGVQPQQVVTVLLAQKFKDQIDERGQQDAAGKRRQAKQHRRAWHKRRKQGGIEQRGGGHRSQQQRQPLPVERKTVPESLRDRGRKQGDKRRGQQAVAAQQAFAVQPEQQQHRRNYQGGPIAARQQDQQREIDAVRQKQRRLIAVVGQIETKRP